jgi:AbrB family looped-hinge helix DNA binding protein
MKPMRDAWRMAVKAIAKVGTKGRIYLPPEVRDTLKVAEGEFIAFREERGRVYLEKLV